MSDAQSHPRLLTHSDLDELEAMRAKILESHQYLRGYPLLYHLVEVELPRLIATARDGLSRGSGAGAE